MSNDTGRTGIISRPFISRRFYHVTLAGNYFLGLRAWSFHGLRPERIIHKPLAVKEL